MLHKSKSKFLKIYKSLGIKKNDTVLLYVNTLKLLLLFKQQFKNQKLKLEELINNICTDVIDDLQKILQLYISMGIKLLLRL